MAVLTDNNLTNYKKYLDDLKTQINSWTSYLSNAESLINKGTGSQFKTEYTKGKKAIENIQSVINILQSIKGDLNKLVTDADSFYITSNKASKSKNINVACLYGCPMSASVKEAITEAELYSETDSVKKTINIA